MHFLNKYKKYILTFLIFFCFVAAIYSVNRINPSFFEKNLGFVLTPIQKAITKSNKWIKEKYQLILNIDEVKKENESLKLELALKEQNEAKLKQLEAENKRLTNLLKLDSRYAEYEKTAANIISKNPGNWYETFIIDKGKKDGLEKNMIVISSKGLVGRIKEVGKNYSKVISIIDDIDAISSKSLRTDDIGFIHGDLENKGFCKMEYIDSTAEIIVGDEIVTSHLSDIYPPGITIGYVTDISLDKNGLSKTAVVEPVVDFKHLENVLIITEIFDDVKNANSELN